MRSVRSSPAWAPTVRPGCSILETSANPYVLSLGPEQTATRRLNFAQAFNPVGTNLGVLLAATLILPKLDEPVNMANLSPAEVRTIRAGELGLHAGGIDKLRVTLNESHVARAWYEGRVAR